MPGVDSPVAGPCEFCQRAPVYSRSTSVIVKVIAYVKSVIPVATEAAILSLSSNASATMTPVTFDPFAKSFFTHHMYR